MIMPDFKGPKPGSPADQSRFRQRQFSGLLRLGEGDVNMYHIIICLIQDAHVYYYCL